MASETGVAVTDGGGQILGAGWTRCVEQTIGWADSAAGDGDAVLFADAPLVVRDVPGQRVCETRAGHWCGRRKVSANTTKAHSSRLASVQFLRLAELFGWEDLIDGLLYAWTRIIVARHGYDCCQVLALPANPTGGPGSHRDRPARQDQRLQPLPESALFAAIEDVHPERGDA